MSWYNPCLGDDSVKACTQCRRWVENLDPKPLADAQYVRPYVQPGGKCGTFISKPDKFNGNILNGMPL